MAKEPNPDAFEVRFVPVKDGDLIVDPRRVVRGAYGRIERRETGTNQIIGFKPGPARTRGGHLVVLVRTSHPKSQHLRKMRPATV